MSQIHVTARVELDLVVEGKWVLTTEPDPQQFLMYDNGLDTDSRIIIFVASDALGHLSTAETWFVDGNHAVAHIRFCQLYVLRCPLGNTVGLTLYVLPQRKSQETYDNLLHAIVDTCPELYQDPDPTTIVIDFDIVMVRAVSSLL